MGRCIFRNLVVLISRLLLYCSSTAEPKQLGVRICLQQNRIERVTFQMRGLIIGVCMVYCASQLLLLGYPLFPSLQTETRQVLWPE